MIFKRRRQPPSTKDKKKINDPIEQQFNDDRCRVRFQTMYIIATLLLTLPVTLLVTILYIYKFNVGHDKTLNVQKVFLVGKFQNISVYCHLQLS